nr:hypothetical protein [Tanacetum cinerariifolium]
ASPDVVIVAMVEGVIIGVGVSRDTIGLTKPCGLG